MIIPTDEFRREPAVTELVAEQSITVPQRLDTMIGAGAELWEDDEDLDSFVSEIYECRGIAACGAGQGEQG